jgi:hypothetical protein
MFSPTRRDRAFPRWLEEVERRLEERYRDIKATREFRDVLAGMRASRQKPIEVFIVGEGNFGKSTLLNALLGESLSTVYFLPETSAFLRFVPRTAPSSLATLFVRLRGKEHDWLRPALLELRASEEIPDTQTSTVDTEAAERLLREEARRVRELGPDYPTAIVEVEREVPLRERGALPATARVVDTPGLNQILRSQTELIARLLDGRTTAERVRQWLRETPQGRHFAWQVRRCDVILWVVDAKKSTSEATHVGLELLQQYGKPSLMAVTKVDLIQGGPDEVAKVLTLIGATVGKYVEGIVGVNAKRALEAALAEDEDGLKESGLRELGALLIRHAIDNGPESRARAAYWSLRATEAQMRSAYDTLSQEIQSELTHAADDKAAFEALHRRQVEDLDTWERRQLTQEGESLRAKVERVQKGSTRTEILECLNAAAASIAIELQAHSWLREADDAIRGLGDELSKTSYRMPFFDPHGQRQKDSLRVVYKLSSSRVTFPRLEFVLTIDHFLERWMKNKLDAIIDWLPWGDRERGQRSLEQLRQDLLEQVRRQLADHVRGVRRSMEAQIATQRSEAVRGVSEVVDALGNVEGRPLSDTKAILANLLGRPIVPPLLPHRVLRAVKAYPVFRFLERPPIRSVKAQ